MLEWGEPITPLYYSLGDKSNPLQKMTFKVEKDTLFGKSEF